MNNLKEKIDSLKELDAIYIIGHNNIDCDSCFSSYILSKILKSFGINAYYAIIDKFNFSEENIEIINNFLKEKPVVLDSSLIDNKNFILVDHNDIDQSLKNEKCNVLFAIDHHIDCGKVNECYSEVYTSTLLYIYDLFKEIYTFTEDDKKLIALSVMTDSEYLTSTRYQDSDKKLYEELNADISVAEMRNKYFKTTDFSLPIDYNIKNGHKYYNFENRSIDRAIIKGYSKDQNRIDKYLQEMDKMFNDNKLLIWNTYDDLKTKVYYNSKLVIEYDYILTSTVLILKELIKENII